MCNYGRGGNRLRKRMYQPGKSCSLCPRSTTCSTINRGLCSLNSKENGTNRNSIRRLSPNSEGIRRGNFSIQNYIDSNSIGRITSIKHENTNQKRVTGTFASQARIHTSQQFSRPRQEIRQKQQKSQQRSCNNILCQLGRIFFS